MGSRADGAGRDGGEGGASAVIGVDTGGTFTDLVAWIDGRMIVRKVLSQPHDPGAAVLTALGELGAGAPAIVHGTTVATNALLERRGARVALITTAGFEDLIEIGRQSRPDPYALEPRRPRPLVPRALRFGVEGPLDPADRRTLPAASALAALRETLLAAEVEAVAVCMLFSYAHAEVESRIGAALVDDRWETALSSEVLPVYREYERTSTTVANAYVAPQMSRYLRGLAERSPAPRWSVMASNAGSLDLETAARLPAACLLSGPAGGVLGATRVAAGLELETCMTLDMGGTSTDVCLVERGRIPTSDASVVAGLPIAFPTVDIHTVGAGGGSIVRLDRAGVLRVGPESAGADPGPIAYGSGSRPTVTDANLLLGRIPADTFAALGGAAAAGEASARVDRVREAFATLGGSLGIAPIEAAAAALRSVEASMARALRVISTRRGRDPRGAALICFGGAGPLHGAALAEELGINRVVVPPSPGVLSALGLAGADSRRDYVRAVLQPIEAFDRAGIAALLAELEERARRDARAAGRPEPRVESSLDLRYAGQSHEIEVPFTADFDERFHAEHQRRFGHADHARGVDLIHARVRAVTPGRRFRLAAPELEGGTIAREPQQPPETATPPLAGEHRGPPRIARNRLGAGDVIDGPLVVTEATATTWLPAAWQARVADCGSLLLTRRGRRPAPDGGKAS